MAPPPAHTVGNENVESDNTNGTNHNSCHNINIVVQSSNNSETLGTGAVPKKSFSTGQTLKTLNDLLQQARENEAHKQTSQSAIPQETLLPRTLNRLSPAESQQAAERNYVFAGNQRRSTSRRQRTISNSALTLRRTGSPDVAIGVVTHNVNNNSNEQLLGPRTAPVGLHTLLSRLVRGTGHDTHTTRTQIEILRSLLGLDENWNCNSITTLNLDGPLNSIMVHEINPDAAEAPGVVNSASLEDVESSALSDNRAQSIQSLHSSVETPTPDTTPSFDELQKRLETSGRNMQNIQTEQNKLVQLQDLAKTHLSEMERLRQQADRLPHQGGGDAPNYETVQQVQADMASLVDRMKNVTSFIHNQNELSNLLGDDSPEMLAEQQRLERKLEELRVQREDMRNLVEELNNINATAKDTAQTVRRSLELDEQSSTSGQVGTKERVVPVEYQRNVPILRQEAASAAQRAQEAQERINQKTADIDALRAQMHRLKSMLNKVSEIEDGIPNAGQALEGTSSIGNDNIVRANALHDVTTELRAEAAILQKERNRIMALKEEIEKRKQQAAAAAQLGDDAIKRISLTPTPTPRQQIQSADEREDDDIDGSIHTREELRAQCQLLREVYERKQREYDARFKIKKEPNTNTTSEADDEGNDDTDSDKFFGHMRSSSSATLCRPASASTVVESRHALPLQSRQVPHQHAQVPLPPPSHSLSNNEDELNVTIDSLSLGNDSLQSSSTRSQYGVMPPPMAPVHGNWGNAWNGPPLGDYAGATSSTFNPANVNNNNNSNAQTNGNGPGSLGSNVGDSVLLHQFMQTQHVLINSICQCNETLWHQQREIDNLNTQLLALQKRVNGSNDQNFVCLRSESMPPVANNLCLGGRNRGQSEQLYSFGAHNSAFANYHQNQRHMNGFGSYSSDTQQHHHHNSSVYQVALNNAAAAAAAAAPSPSTTYNNEAPLPSPVYRASPGPIFMNHHNNTIHQNNANLRTQNHHANNLHPSPGEQVEQQQQRRAPQQPTTLNNQVPPGNRANNYWDNFRSYTRQNLLSINSSKSNEELDLEHQQYRQMQRQIARAVYDQYQQVPPHRHVYQTPVLRNTATSSSSNNLNNSSNSRRSSDWQEQSNVDDSESHENNIIYGGRRRNHRRMLPTLHDEETLCDEASNLLNMNVNSPLYQRNKLPAKPTTSAVSLTPLQQRQLRFDFEHNYAYGSQFGSPPSTPVAAPVYNVTVQEHAATDESNTLEAEDTASEELNRNLLVNALKNDKFTKKFYESIKEDVYRRLETLFEQQQRQQVQRHSEQHSQQKQLYNTLRKASNQTQQHTASLVSNMEASAVRENDENEETTESGTETPLQIEVQLQVESDRPEDENISPTQGAIAPPKEKSERELASANGPIKQNSEAAAVAAVKIGDQIIATLIECSSAATPSVGDISVTPDHELIEYIIKRIRNQTHENTTINDSLLAEVSKLTATAAQNSAINWTPHTSTAPFISPKRIYAKIKKMDIPRQRDEFLHWYRAYLEQLFVVEEQQSSSQPIKDKKSESKKIYENELAKTSKKLLNGRIRAQSQSQDSNDADLAEADQKVSSNGIKSDVECENNENPEEEGAAAPSSQDFSAP